MTVTSDKWQLLFQLLSGLRFNQPYGIWLLLEKLDQFIESTALVFHIQDNTVNWHQLRSK